jgi:hypothetical protein
VNSEKLMEKDAVEESAQPDAHKGSSHDERPLVRSGWAFPLLEALNRLHPTTGRDQPE